MIASLVNQTHSSGWCVYPYNLQWISATLRKKGSGSHDYITAMRSYITTEIHDEHNSKFDMLVLHCLVRRPCALATRL